MQAITPLDYHEAQQAIDLLFKSRASVLLKSGPGQGKTSLIRDYAEKRGPDYGLFELNCALSNQPDYAGWFHMVKEIYTDFDGNERAINAGRYSFPSFLFDKRTGRPIFQYKAGVIVFEEYGQADPDLKRALGQCFLEKRIGLFQCDEAFDVIALSNRDTDRSGVTKDYDFLINRRAELNYQLSLDAFNLYGHRKQFTPMTMAFASVPHHEVFTAVMPKDQGPWLTPRSLEMLDNLMKVVATAKMRIDDPLVRTMAAAEVGAGAAHQYVAFAALRSEIPSVADIIRDPKKTKLPSSIDQRMFLVFLMADSATKGNVKPLVEYLNRMPADMAVTFYKNALARDKTLINVREFGDFCVANKTLLAVVNANK